MRLNIRSIVESLTYLKSEIDSKLSGKADRSHNHDDRYYTENEANGLLDGKADAVHNHSKSQISDFAHNHDDRYYTESEIDSKLSGKAGTSTATQSSNGLMSSQDKVKLDGIATGANKTVVDNALSNDSTNPVQNKVVKSALDGKSDKGHNHDDRYYTESEINSVVSRLEGLIDGVAGFTATEVSSLPATGENGVLYLVPKTGGGSDVHDEYVWVASTGRFELVGSTSVNLDGYYTSSQVDVLLNGKSSTGHNHDDRYYTESEIDNKLSGKAGTSTATQSSNGLMSSSDKVKLDGIEANANKITVDSSLSSSSTNPVQNKIVKSALDSKAESNHTHTRGQITDFSHVHDDRYYTEGEVDSLLENKASNVVASASSNGLMSKEDKVKLDTVSSNASKVEFTRNVNEGAKIGTIKINNTATDIYAPANEGQAGEYDVATASSDGLMSSTDKAKLDTVHSNASKVEWTRTQNTGVKIGTLKINDVSSDVYAPQVTIDDSLNSSSENPVQNKIVNNAIAGKADSIHTHSQSDITGLSGALEGKAEAVHTHSTGDVTGLDTVLEGKAGTSVATNSANGLMSKEDKAKLDSLVNTASSEELDTLLNGGVFVGTGGSDSTGTGSLSHPYATITKALNEAEANGTIFLLNGVYTGFREVTFNKSCRVIGLGEVVLDAGKYNRHVTVNEGVEVVFKNITFKNGKSNDGGGIYAGGVLSVTDCVFEGNTANNGGGILNNDGGVLSVADCVFEGNTANSYGGGIRNNGDLSVADCVFEGNTAYNGGGILSFGQSLTLTNTTLKNNTAYSGGAIRNTSSITLLHNRITGEIRNTGTIIKQKGNIINGVADYENTATTTSNGLMSSTDKTKLNGVENGANKTVVDSSLSTTSTNPVQNNIVTNALTSKLEILETGQINANKNDITGSISFIKARAGDTNILIISNINLRFTNTTGKDLTTAYEISDTKIPLDDFSVVTNWRLLAGLNISHALFLVETDGTVKLRMQGTLNTNMIYGEVTYMSNPPLIQ